MTDRKTYLGDSVYYDNDGCCVVLTTENGVEVSNTICIEPEVMRSLLFVLCRDYGKETITKIVDATWVRHE